MKKLLSVITFCLLLLFSCKESTSPSDNNNNIPGNITGNIETMDENGVLLNDFGGVNISIKGTNYSTQSDLKGKWTLKDIAPGVYDIIFSKPGFDSLVIFGYPFPGNGTAYINFQDFHYSTDFFDYYFNNWVIVQKPTTDISNFSIGANYQADTSGTKDSVYISEEYIPVNLKIDKEICLTFFFSLNPNVSKYDYQEVYKSCDRYDQMEYNPNSGILKFKFSKHYLESHFQHGDKLYIASYPGSGGYTMDLRNNYRQWLYLGEPLPVASIVIP
jgi:hypothetical protein